MNYSEVSREIRLMNAEIVWDNLLVHKEPEYQLHKMSYYIEDLRRFEIDNTTKPARYRVINEFRPQ